MSRLFPVKGQRQVLLGGTDIPAEQGEILFSTTPQFAVLNTILLDTHCSGCLRSPEQISEDTDTDLAEVKNRLLTCILPPSLPKRCFAKSAEMHQRECRRLKEIPSWKPSTMARLLAQVLLTFRDNEGNRRVLDDLPLSYSETSNNLLEFLKDGRFQEDMEILLGTRHKGEGGGYTYTLFETEYGIWDEEEYSSVLRKLLSCKFIIYSEAGNPVGLGFSPFMTRFRHSCRPNCQIVFHSPPNEKGNMKFVASRSIKPGKEVTISYLELCLPIHLRQDSLEVYGFDHSTCSLCADTPLDPRWTALHLDCLKNGRIPLLPIGHSRNKNDSPPTENERCPKCSDKVSLESSNDLYIELIECLEDEWNREIEGVTLPREPNKFVAIREEIENLSPLLEIVSECNPPTTYPIPYLQLRLGRLYRNSPGDKKNLFRSIDQWQKAYQSIHQLHHRVPAPLTCQLAIDLCEAYLQAVRHYRKAQRKTPKPRNPMKTNRRPEVAPNGDNSDNDIQERANVRETSDIAAANRPLPGYKLDGKSLDEDAKRAESADQTEAAKSPESAEPEDDVDSWMDEEEASDLRNHVDEWTDVYQSSQNSDDDQDEVGTSVNTLPTAHNDTDHQDTKISVTRKDMTGRLRAEEADSTAKSTLAKKVISTAQKGAGSAQEPDQVDFLLDDAQYDDIPEKISALSRNGKIWNRQARLHLQTLGFDEGHRRCLLLKKWDRELDYLDTWFQYLV
uniref:SET domain-containing protein n=1 Tax=Kwoniella pini CBS 10737 TaxID=1296096 RepID=A0A1B9HSR8_9TREE|nr:uncharacterized protein I206_07795 [Kwoniella pini CBS 10737]OCF46314.1 hypothetical protein I206_07795 [Kwoniella pini CBS 10737]